MSSFDFAEVLAEYSRAVRLSLLSIESLQDEPGLDRGRIDTLSRSIRHTHTQVTAYLATLIEASSKLEASSAEAARHEAGDRAVAVGSEIG